MRQEYRLSARAILYALYKLRCHGMYGLPAVMPDPRSAEFPLFAQKCEEEILAAGLSSMDFDGEVTLDQEFSTLLRSCARCHGVAAARLKHKGVLRKVTLYPNAGAMLLRDEEEQCVLKAAEDVAGELLALLALPGDVPGCDSLRVNTDHLEQRDRDGLMADGCSEELADALLADLAGAGGYAHIVRTVFRNRTDDLMLLHGGDHRLVAAAEYADGQEWLRLSPISHEAVEEQVRQLAQAMFTHWEDDDDEVQEDR